MYRKKSPVVSNTLQPFGISMGLLSQSLFIPLIAIRSVDRLISRWGFGVGWLGVAIHLKTLSHSLSTRLILQELSHSLSARLILQDYRTRYPLA